MKPEDITLIVTRVQNGWTVGPFGWNHGDARMYTEQFVARTPKELADMMQDWASRQTDQKP